jgi:hypothetical protein
MCADLPFYLLLLPQHALQLRPQDPDHRTLPLNHLTAPITVESDFFSGQLVLTFRGTPSTPQHLFEGRRRRMWLALQVCTSIGDSCA